MTQQTLSRRRAETRERLIDAAIAVFARDGIDHARLEDISEEAGYTRGAFYSNFADKNDLIIALLEREIERTTDVARQGISIALDHPEELDLSALVNRALDAVAQQSPSAQWLVVEQALRLYALRDAETAEQLARYETQRNEALSALLEQAITASNRRCTIPIDHAIAIILAVGTGTFAMEQAAQAAPAGQVRQAGPDSRDVLVSLLASVTEPIA
ncbi:TetR/AcrR family transcriptional regulator [Microlunatus sp. Y2014]|uniref:TetR/AcrR family transcriptional regulator n=1 Tax=Microlunatus sp. Y2014 TaxID=3418488 RepID=UPI003DA76415